MAYDYSDCAQARQCGTHKSRNHTPWYLFSKCLTPFLLGTFFDFHDISAGHQDLAEQKTP